MIYRLLYKILVKITKVDDMLKVAPMDEFDMYNLPEEESKRNIKRSKLARTKHMIRFVDAENEKERRLIRGCILECELEIFSYNKAMKIRQDDKIISYVDRVKKFVEGQRIRERKFWSIIKNKIGIFK